MKSKSGFTIVELLIVIIVIAILAAITIVAYNGLTAKAKEASVQSDIESNMRKVLLLRVDRDTETNCSDFMTSNTSINPYPLKLSNTSAIQSVYIYATKPDASGGWPAFTTQYNVAHIIIMTSGKVYANTSTATSPRDVTAFYTAASNSPSGAIQGAYSVVVGAGCFLGP